MSERGVFAVDRGIWSDVDFADEPFSEREAFLWLVSESAWRPIRVRVAKAAIDLDRGQCAFSTRFMAEKWKWSEARVRRFLGRLKKSRIIDTHTDAHATLVTISKYDRFQRVGLPTDAPSDAEATQERRKEETLKQGNTPSSLRSEGGAPRGADRSRGTRIAADWVLDDIGRAYAVSIGLAPTDVSVEAEKFRDWWLGKAGSDGRKVDWAATWRTWARGAVERRGRANGARAGPPRDAHRGPRNPHFAALDDFFSRETT